MKSLTQHFAGGQYQAWALKFMLVFFFYDDTFLKLKHILGAIERSFLGIYTQAEHLRMYILLDD